MRSIKRTRSVTASAAPASTPARTEARWGPRPSGSGCPRREGCVSTRRACRSELLSARSQRSDKVGPDPFYSFGCYQRSCLVAQPALLTYLELRAALSWPSALRVTEAALARALHANDVM